MIPSTLPPPRPVSLKSVHVEHKDPYLRRDLMLVVFTEDARGQVLDVPEVFDVEAVRLHELDASPRYYLSYKAGTLCAAASQALTREFNARLKADESLRRWLVAAAFEAQIAASMPPRQHPRNGIFPGPGSES